MCIPADKDIYWESMCYWVINEEGGRALTVHLRYVLPHHSYFKKINKEKNLPNRKPRYNCSMLL
jgi:hypothetical protein